MKHLLQGILLLSLAVFVASPTFACSCIGNSTPCSALKGTPVVFVGKVIRDTGSAGLGERTAILQIEETFHGLPAGLREVEVDSMAGTSCYMALEAGERYVIFGGLDEKNPGLLHNYPCTGSFNAKGNGELIQAMREAELGGTSKLVGKAYAGANGYGGGELLEAGIRIIAEMDDERRESVTSADGEFSFSNIRPGEWRLSVDAPGFINHQNWTPQTRPVPLDGCEHTSVTAAIDGRISGFVHGTSGEPIEGAVVQAFAWLNQRADFETRAVASSETDERGEYTLRGLMPTTYIVGINGEPYSDDSPYRPVFYPQADRKGAAQIQLAKLEQREGVDLIVQEARERSILTVITVYEDGSPFFGGVVEARDLDGIQRAFSDANDENPEYLTLPVWMGETYVVQAAHLEIQSDLTPDNRFLFKSSEWRGETGPVQVNDQEMQVQVVMKLKSE